MLKLKMQSLLIKWKNLFLCTSVINTCTFIYDIINISFSLSILSFLLHTCITIIEIFNYNLSLRDYNCIQALFVFFELWIIYLF